MDILGILKKHGFTFSKKFGQNFLTDEQLLCDIVRLADVTEKDTVVEVGTGAGTLTRAISAAAGRVLSFEIDRALEPVLSETLAGRNNVELIMDDVTKWTDEELDAAIGTDYKVVANLPYYITTPLLLLFLTRKNKPRSITVMVQEEMAERICATEKKGDYGALSVGVALHGKAQIIKRVPRSEFTPPPNVDSAVVRIDLFDKPIAENKKLDMLIMRAFAMKRKTLVNNLSSGYSVDKQTVKDWLKRLNKSETARAEELSPDEFVKLAEIIEGGNYLG